MSVKYAVINLSASGDTTVIPAVAGKRLRVVGYTTAAAGAVSLTWKSNSTAISGVMPMIAGPGVSGSFGGGTYMMEFGIIQTAVGEPLVANLSAAVGVGGHLVYREVQV